MIFTKFTVYLSFEPGDSNNESDPQPFFSENQVLIIQESEKSFCNPQSMKVSRDASDALSTFLDSQKDIHPGYSANEIFVNAIE